MSEKKITLSIETAVEGGSLSVLEGVSELDCQIGRQQISSSKDVLEEIQKILERNNIRKKNVEKIVVSRGPGSFTGVRVGLAIGFGLKKALDCQLVGMSTLEAMLIVGKTANIDGGEVTTAVPIGRNQVCWQNFKNSGKIVDTQTSPKLSTISDFLNFCIESNIQSKKIILHRKLYLEIRDKFQKYPAGNILLVDAGENIAVLIGMAGAKPDGQGLLLHPIYIAAD